MDAAAAASMVGSSMSLPPPRPSTLLLTAHEPRFLRFHAKHALIFPIKHCSSVSYSKLQTRRIAFGSRGGMVVRALSSPDSAEPAAAVAPLQMESPIGQFLSRILISHPHLLLAAVEQQLQQLQTDRDAEQKKEEVTASGTDLVLYRRIAEIKSNEREKALEEILYALVVQRFMDANVSLVPALTPSSTDPSGRVDTWPSQEDKFEKLHSSEAYEMIQNDLALILGKRLGDTTSVAQISKRTAGRVYAASAMYGYFLKRVDQRFQLEKSMKILPNPSDGEQNNIQQAVRKDMRPSGLGDSVEDVSSHPEVSSWAGTVSPVGFGNGLKPSRLWNYIVSFDGDTLQKYAIVRSKETVSIVEKHTEALFGKPEIVITPQGTADSSKDEVIKISFGGLKRLVLEAVTFGSFLWDVESFVDSRYNFVMF